MAVDNDLNPRVGLDNRPCHEYQKDKNHGGVHRSGSSQNTKYGSNKDHYSNKAPQDVISDSDDNLNWKGRPRAEDPNSSFIAGQIMRLPKNEPRSDLQAWGSNGKPMHEKAYGHPVLVLTNPDKDDCVIVQKVSDILPPCLPSFKQ